MSEHQVDRRPAGPDAGPSGRDAPDPPTTDEHSTGPLPADAAATTGGDADDSSVALADMATTSTNRYLLVGVLVTGLLVVIVAGFLLTARERSERDRRFDDVAVQARDGVDREFARYADALAGLRSLLGSGEVGAEEFDGYVGALDLSDRYPGARIMGYAPRAPGGQYPVALLSPLPGNEDLVGIDLTEDALGRAAVEAAVTSGSVTMGPPLVERSGEAAGERRVLNVFMPFYDGPTPQSEQARRDRVAGVVLMVFSPEEAFAPAFEGHRRARVELYDLGTVDGSAGVEPTERNVLFATDGELDAVAGGGRPQRRFEMELGRRSWLLYVAPGPGFSGPRVALTGLVVLLILVITGLTTALVLSYARTRKQAAVLAEQTTAYLRERETQLQRANEDIVRSNKDLERYASIAAHDLQEPLRSLLAYASVLERRYGDSLEPEVLDQVQRMGRAAERMRSLVVDLLAYARAESEQRPIEAVDLNEAVRIAVDDLSVLIHETGATIRIATLPTVPGNRRELIGVFSNLLSNALKYRSEQPPEVVIVAHDRGTEWIVGVRDNGLGIAPAYHERIFELFRRLEKRSQDSGTGIGLAICARTVAQHGGRIWVESEEGEGATFWFTLPSQRLDIAGTPR
jgi:signal transduction histidine kinase